MQSSLLADDDLPDAASLVASVTRRATPGHFDEWCAGVAGTAASAAHGPAPHWRQFFQTLGTEGWADLAARAQRVQSRVREDGATFVTALDWQTAGAHAAPVAARNLEATRRAEAKMKGYVGESCPECQNFTLVRNGTCLKCDTCGSTTGCS